MLRNSTWRLDETNLANFGSELEKRHRKEEGALEQAWSYEGSPIGQEAGLWIWRVQNFQLTPVSEPQFGKFYQGDSYVLLKSDKKENSPALVHHIHFWLGLETTQDEAGTAAYKTVELDDYLDSLATQHREVQRRESQRFQSYFKYITYLQGGFASGFHHVEEETLPTRLLRVHRPRSLEHTRTKNAVVISEVPLSYESLVSSDVFVLDAGNVVYQWQGDHAIGIERAKAAEFIAQLISERNGKGDMHVVGQNGDLSFWEALGSKGDIRDDTSSEDEEDGSSTTKSLWRPVAGDQGLSFENVAEGTVSKDMFDTHDVLVFDVGHQVFAWIGQEAERDKRRNGLQYAQDYVKSQERPVFTPICRVLEGAEDELFQSALEGWQGW